MTDLLAAHRRRMLFVPTAIVAAMALLVATLTSWGPSLSAVYREHRDQRWVPASWVLTVDDFPDGDAEVIPVREEWLARPSRDDPYGPRTPVPHRLPGLELITSPGYGWDWCGDLWTTGLHRGDVAVSGVRTGDLEVFTLAAHPEAPRPAAYLLGVNLRDPAAGSHVDPQVPQTALLCDGPAPAEVAPLGDRIVPGPGGSPVELRGDRGWAGLTGPSPSGSAAGSRQVAAAVAWFDDRVVLLGVTAPAGATVDWEAEIDRLVAAATPATTV